MLRGNFYRKDLTSAFWLLFFQIIFSSLYSQSQKTDIFLSAGYGLPTFRQAFPFDQSAYGFNKTGYSFARSEWKKQNQRSSFVLSAFLGFRDDGSGAKSSGYGLGMRYSYYFRSSETFHLYGAAGIGVQREDYPYADLYGELFLGARLKLYKKLWAYAEAGFGKTLLQAGIALKFENVSGASSATPDKSEEEKIRAIKFDTTEKSAFTISAGYGIPNFMSAVYYLSPTSGSEYRVVHDHGAYFLRAEKYLPRRQLSIGVTVYYSSQQIEFHYQGHSYYNYSVEKLYFEDLGIGIRNNLYFVRKAHFHSYLGMGFGAKIALRNSGDAPVYGEFVFGFRFMPDPHFGFFLEIGPSKVLAQGGIAIKL